MRARRPIRDYYKILSIDASASHEEIRSSYRRLAKRFHPDVTISKEAGLWMRLINEAYDVLGDKRKRVIYDYIFLAYSELFAHEGAGHIDAVILLSTSRQGRFRYIFSTIVVHIIGLQDSLDLVLMSLLIFASALYVLFRQGELAAGLIAFLLISAAIVIMVRVFAEIFGRAGIRVAEPWFHEILMTHNNSLKRTPEDGKK
jgi:hypothetical protein